MTAVSVVIVSWNTRTLLLGCLESLRSRNPANSLQIIVVDNASADGSVEAVTERFPGVQIIRNESNRGFAAATNQGLERAVGRSVLLLNPDTEAVADAVEELAR